MGSQSNHLAYIAGFLDGDGSLMLQIKKRSDGKTKIRFMATICFYQDTRHEKPLYWIQKILGIGYISRRNDGMSELRINGFVQVKNILKILLPFIQFKKTQAMSLYSACVLLSGTKYKLLNRKQLSDLIDLIIVIQQENYITRKKRSREELFKMLDLTP